MSLKVEWGRRALKARDKLDKVVRERVLDAIERFAATGAGDVKALKGCDEYRLRVGDWRVRFVLKGGDTLVVVFVAHRREAY